MPAVSRAQQIAMAIAEHEPDTLYARNRGMMNMSHSQLHDFAATKRTGLPAHVSSAPHPHRNLGTFLHPPKGMRMASHLTALRKKGAFTAPRGAMKKPGVYGRS